MKSAAGIEKGATKVFLRQPAFDSLEKIRGTVLSVKSVKIQALARSFVYQRKFSRLMHRITLAQAGARRFLARKHLRGIQRKRAATRVQAYIRLTSAKTRFVARRNVAQHMQKMYRGQVVREKCKILQAKRREERKLGNAAITIQTLHRSRAARKEYEEIKLAKRRESTETPKVASKALKEAIQAHRLAAVSRQDAMDRAKEVDDLTTNLASAKNTAAKAEFAFHELEAVKAELAEARAEVDKLRNETRLSSIREKELETENRLLKEKIDGGSFAVEDKYNKSMYNDFPDLEQLDKQMWEMVARSKNSKEDVKTLVSALSILR